MKPISANSQISPKRPPRPRDKFLVFGSPAIGEEEIAEVVDTLRSGWLGTGPKVARFEKDFAAYKGAGHPVAVNSCTAALQLSMIAAAVGTGDDEDTVRHTYAATAKAIVQTGATPVYDHVDVLKK